MHISSSDKETTEMCDADVLTAANWANTYCTLCAPVLAQSQFKRWEFLRTIFRCARPVICAMQQTQNEHIYLLRKSICTATTLRQWRWFIIFSFQFRWFLALHFVTPNRLIKFRFGNSRRCRSNGKTCRTPHRHWAQIKTATSKCRMYLLHQFACKGRRTNERQWEINRWIKNGFPQIHSEWMEMRIRISPREFQVFFAPNKLSCSIECASNRISYFAHCMNGMAIGPHECFVLYSLHTKYLNFYCVKLSSDELQKCDIRLNGVHEEINIQTQCFHNKTLAMG